MKRKKRVYIAGPMRGYAEFNFPAFFRAEERAKKKGFRVINPARLDVKEHLDPRLLTPKQIKKILPYVVKRDLECLMKCDAIALLPGWEESAGATAEYLVAEWLDLEILDGVTFRRQCDLPRLWYPDV